MAPTPVTSNDGFAATSSPRDDTAPRDAAYRVLLIEDDHADTVLFRDGVGEIDPELAITTASSIEEASRYFATGLDCIVLDLGLPGTIDLEALTAVRAATPEVAIVVLTGWGDEKIGTAAVATGAQDYLIKGEATPPTIARSVRFAIERKRNERSTAMLLRSELENVERERLERALLATPHFRRDDLSWRTRYDAARTGVVSGDFLDGVELPDGTIRAVIGDVAGHGPDEAALGVSLRAGWRALVLSGLPGDMTLAALEDMLITERSTTDAYATVCDVSISPNLRTAVVRSAGHPPPVLAGVGALVDTNLRSPLGMRFGERRWVGTSFELPLDVVARALHRRLVRDPLRGGRHLFDRRRADSGRRLGRRRVHRSRPPPRLVRLEELRGLARRRCPCCRVVAGVGQPVTQPARHGATALGKLADRTLLTGLVAVVIGVIVIWLSFDNLLDARRSLFDRYEPALVRTEKLRTALLDQETGVRGYARAGDLRFLEPYQIGQADEATYTRDIRRLAGDDPDVDAALDVVTKAAASWRDDIAAPMLAEPSGGDTDADALRAKEGFDDVRLAVTQLEREVTAARVDARSDLDQTTTTLGIAIGLAVATITASAFYTSWLLRRRVIAPVAQLVTQTDSVEMGRFDHAIDVSGPLEIERLAERIDDMRQRIVEELAKAEESRAELDRRSESLERSNRDLEQFAYVASHDLQEPLRKVASFCQLLEQRYGDELDEKGQLYISYAVDGAKRMQALIADLLDFSRVGRNTASFVPCDLQALVADVVESNSVGIEATGARIRFADLPTVDGDPSLLAALFQNLINNALKYRTPDVDPEVHISATPNDGDMDVRAA